MMFEQTNLEKGRIPPTPMGYAQKLGLGAYFIVLMVLLLYFFVSFWPESSISIFGAPYFDIGREIRIILLVVFAGALGACLHGITSFTYFAGKRELHRSWGWWYILRPFIGAGLALLLYLAIRGIMFATSANSDAVNIFGIVALAGLTGMFSKQAIEKLRQVFDTLFARLTGVEEEKEE
ncbi:MAG TPA: hypothetical protein EYP60_03185 [bacterium (Candidatus Stahlbacteria)]|nr:hypothetical protein [Candidatus Stahlbacteria bacterium]